MLRMQLRLEVLTRHTKDHLVGHELPLTYLDDQVGELFIVEVF